MGKGAFIPPQNGAAGGGGGSSGSAISSIIAGTATATGPAVSFANSNGVTFGITGNTVTASIPAGAAPGGLSAGTASVELGTVVLSNSHNVTFGLAGSTVTASAGFTQSTQPQEPVLVRGSGTNIESIATNSTLSFDWAPDGANGRGARFIATNVGGNVRVQGFYSALGVEAGGSSVFGGTGNVVFSNSNNVTFGLNGSTITASATAQASGFLGASGGGSSVDGAGSLLRFLDANGLAWAVSSTNVTQVRVNANYTAVRSISAGTTNAASSALSFADGNGVTFGLNGNTITASVAGGAPETPFAISGGTQSQSTGTVQFSNANGIVFGLDAGTMTVRAASLTGSNGETVRVTASNAPIIISAAGAAGSISVLGNNIIEFGTQISVQASSNLLLSANTAVSIVGASVSVSGLARFDHTAMVLGGATAGARSIAFSNNSGSLQLAANPTANRTVHIPDANGTLALSSQLGPRAISAGTASVSNGTVVFSNANNVSFGLAGSTVTASAGGAGTTIRFWDNAALGVFGFGIGQGTGAFFDGGYFHRTNLPLAVVATRLDFQAIGQNNGNATFTVALYSCSGQSATRFTTASVTVSLNGNGIFTSASSSISLVSVAIGTITLNAGDYGFAFFGTGNGNPRVMGQPYGPSLSWSNILADNGIGFSSATSLAATALSTNQSLIKPWVRLIGS